MNFFKRHLPFILLSVILICFVSYWYYWHYQPFTADAFIFANTRAVSPWVAGYIEQIHVRNNQVVAKNAPLFTTFRTPYILKIEELEHKIAETRAKLAGTRASLLQAEAEIQRCEADIEQFQFLYSRAVNMLKDAAVSEDYAVQQKRNLKASEALRKAAIHHAVSLKHACSATEAELKKLHASLKLNKLWLSQTTVSAMSDGIITNMTISPGTYCKPGDILFAFVDTSNWYVQANFKENELSEIAPGVKATIRMRQYPDRVYHGTVENCNWSVERRLWSVHTGVAEVKKENEWYLLPQRFPVQIKIDDPDSFLHFGVSAYVELDIPARPVYQFFRELFL